MIVIVYVCIESVCVVYSVYTCIQSICVAYSVYMCIQSMCVVYSVYICWKSSEKDWENLGLAIASNLLVKTEPGSSDDDDGDSCVGGEERIIAIERIFNVPHNCSDRSISHKKYGNRVISSVDLGQDHLCTVQSVRYARSDCLGKVALELYDKLRGSQHHAEP